MVILILALVGFNVFLFLGEGTEFFKDNFAPLVSSITGFFSNLVNNIIGTSQTGAKGVVDVTGDTIKKTAEIPDDIVKGTISSNNTKKKSEDATIAKDAEDVSIKKKDEENDLQKKIDKNTKFDAAQMEAPPKEVKNIGGLDVDNDDNDDVEREPQPDQSTNTTQSSKISNKGGYCYIGEDRGFRSCISIEEGDKCMSGDIFNTKGKCVNNTR
jgi:hypothetical protein